MELTEVQKEADSAGRKAIFFGLGALLLAGLFGWMLAHLASAGPDTQAVVVAATDVPALSQIKAEQLKVVEWPSQSMPHGTFQKVEDVLATQEINISGLLAGESVLADRLSTPDRGLGMSQMVEPNMRAYVVQVDDKMATAEIMHPGANVDVVGTFEDPKTREPITKVVLQNVQILGIGDSVDVERARPRKGDDAGVNHDVVERLRVVTLMVPIADVEILSFASRIAKIDLTLRNKSDVAVVPTKGITFDKALGRNKEVKDPKAPDAGAQQGGGAPSPDAGYHHSHRPRDQGPAIIKVHH